MIRFPNNQEWKIANRVFGDTLPWRYRIAITNFIGAGGAPFTIPTSALREGITAFIPDYPLKYLRSFFNAGFIINIGPAYSDLSADKNRQCLLVHEMVHVWQGYNSIFSLTYVLDSVLCQGLGMINSGSYSGRSAAYSFQAGKPWKDYSAEQQAAIVEKWFENGESTSSSDDLWPYVRDNIRKGIT